MIRADEPVNLPSIGSISLLPELLGTLNLKPKL